MHCYKLSLVSLCVLMLSRSLSALVPRDEDCPVQTYSNNVRVLMDSWRYQSLLSNTNDAVWTTYNSGDSQSNSVWTAESGECESSSVSVCSNAVLETQYISKSLPAPDTYTVKVFVNITFSTNCPTTESDCEGNVELQIKADDGRMLEVMPDNILKLDAGSQLKQFYFDIEPYRTDHFRLVLVSPGSGLCTTVTRVVVYRHECRRLRPGLTVLPATQAPATGRVPVSSYCTENSHHAQTESSQPVLECDYTGMWFNDQTVCQCNYGFYREGTVCIAITIVPKPGVMHNVMEDQGYVEVCFHQMNDNFRISTSDMSAIENFDYVPVDKMVSFRQGQLTQCVNITILSDDLSEGAESFRVTVFSSHVTMAVVWIMNNTGGVECTEGNLTLVRDADNSSLQLVEMCRNEGVWSPPCDNEWTLQDATVVCRELGYTNLANRTTIGDGSTMNMIQCSGAEYRLMDCLSQQSPHSKQDCQYLLVECANPMPPIVEPSPPTITIHSLGESSTIHIATTPDVTEPSSSEERFPIGGIAAIAILALVVIAAIIALVFGLTIAVLSRKRKLKEGHTQSGHLSNPVYETAVQNDNVVKTKSSSESGVGGEQDEERSTTLYNPLYTVPKGTHTTSNGNGVDRSKLGYEAPEYSAIRTSTVEYETPLVTSPPFTSSPGSTPPPPPHVYDYAAVPPHIDPEYAPLEGVATRSASNEPPAHVTYHTLEGPVNTVTYHTLEPPKSPENGCELEGQTREIGAEEGGANGDCHEYATLENNIYH